MIYTLSSIYPVRVLCQEMAVNRSGYYKWKKRRHTLNRYEKQRASVYVLLNDYHQKRPSKGYRSLNNMILKQTGWILSDPFIHSCCKYLGIHSKATQAKRSSKGREHSIYKNLIQGDWHTTRPLEKVVSDMTLLHTQGKAYEWTYLLDIFSHEIIAHHGSFVCGDPRPYHRCMDELKEKMKEQTLPVTLHTDQGAVYSSKAFNQAHCDYNIIRSMSRIATPTDNPIIESLNGWIKQELFLDYDYKQTKNLPKLLEEYVHYFNYERSAYSLNYKTPVQFRIEQGFG